ncbi:MAG: sterol desaturase family protein [Cyclobacteriaceae bacterium]|nr:sterol desaturase family protein [Cyclobacteriaceae bacterium]
MFYFLSKNFWGDPWLVAMFLASVLVIIFLRYVFVAYFYNKIFRAITKSQLNIYLTKKKQVIKEIKWSFISSGIFTVYGALCFWAYQQGYTSIYEEVSAYPIWYLCISPLLFLFFYETYYYWLHRWMHRPGIYKIVHHVHHQSIDTTVFTSFSFHPLEASLQFLFFPIAIFFIPMHYTIVLLVLTILTLSAVINHSGMEIFKKSFLLKNIIGFSHHHLHHVEFKTNYGLYLTWWDKWMRTESKTPLE